MSAIEPAGAGWLPSVSQVRRVDVAAVRGAAARSQRLLDETTRLLDLVIRTHPDPSWEGWAAADGTHRHTEVVAVGHVVRTAMERLSSAAAAAARGAEEARDLIRRADRLAGQLGLRVLDSGEVVPVAGEFGTASPAPHAVREVTSLVAQARARYVSASAGFVVVSAPRLAGVADVAWRPPAAGDPVPSRVDAELASLKPLTGAALASAFAALTPALQAAVLAGDPAWAGQAVGLPGWARDTANRCLLIGLLPKLRRDLEEAEEAEARREDDPRLLYLRVPATVLAVLDARARLQDAETLLAVLDQRDGRTRQLLALGSDGRRLTAAVSSGDVDRAARLAVFVPGFTSTVATQLIRYERDSAGASDLATALMRQRGAEGEVVAITWMGYPAPLVDEVMLPSRTVLGEQVAKDGATRLADFLTGIRAAHVFAGSTATAPPIAVWGHSYGSLLAALMLRDHDVPVDYFAAAGSPGFGVADVGKLRLPEGRVYAIATSDDPVAGTGWFVKDPRSLPGVTVLESHVSPLPDGTQGAGIGGHSRYFEPGSTSMWSLAAIAAGRVDLAVVEDPCHRRVSFQPAACATR